MRDREVVPVVLPDEESRDILTGLILPTWTRHAAHQERPVVVFVVGQPGSGKSALADLVHAVLDRRGGAVRIGSDLYKTVHRHYDDLMAEDGRTAGVKVRPDTRRWQAAVEAFVRDHGFDAVVETALADPDEFRTEALAYRQARFRIEVVALATSEALSQLGVLDRYVEQVHAAGAGRYVSWENHDACAKAMIQALAVIEAEHLADRVTVVRRGTEVLYGNELVSGVWRRPPASDKAVTAERLRPWTARETAQFRRELSRTEQRVHHDRVPAERRLAVRGDAERAFALSEPVRRIAQPRTEPPGVDYHRLSAAEHRWIFNELIASSYLNDITPQDHPVAVYVMGQPGAGKTRAANLVHRALRGRKATRIVGEDFKASHPDYHQLLKDNPRGAGAAIRTDYQAWQAEAEAYVRARRGDLVIEIAPGSPEQFLRSANASHQAGYQVELLVLAVRAADSRQGTAHRFALVQQHGMPARFTTTSGHDTCYRAVAETVRAAEQGPAVVDSVVVMRRDGTTVYRNQRSTSGQRNRPAAAAQILRAERHRPYTPQEAAQFFAVQRMLRSALPQYWAELAQITALARPLMPAHLQPRRLGRPAAPVALPVRAPQQ